VLGVLLVVTYIIMDLFALSYTDQTIITSCGGMAVVWNMLIAPMTLGEAVTKSRLIGSAIIVTGTIMAACSGNHYDVEWSTEQYLELLKQPQAIWFYAIWGSGSILLILLLCRTPSPSMASLPDGDRNELPPKPGWTQGALAHELNETEGEEDRAKRSCCPAFSTSDDRSERGFFWGMLAGFIAGNSWATKTCVSLLACSWDGTCGPDEGWDNPLTWGFGAMTAVIHIGAYLIIIWALKYYDALVVVTSSDAFTIVVGAVSGMLVLEEAQIPPLTPAGLACYICAIVVIVIGLSIILLRKHCIGDDGIIRTVAGCYQQCGVTMRGPDIPASVSSTNVYEAWL